MGDKDKRLILTLCGFLLLFYALSPDPLPVVIDDIFAGIVGIKLIRGK